jgi:hypothetical protein
MWANSSWHNPSNNATVPVPRNRDISELLACKFCKDLGIPPP